MTSQPSDSKKDLGSLSSSLHEDETDNIVLPKRKQKKNCSSMPVDLLSQLINKQDEEVLCNTSQVNSQLNQFCTQNGKIDIFNFSNLQESNLNEFSYEDEDEVVSNKHITVGGIPLQNIYENSEWIKPFQCFLCTNVAIQPIRCSTCSSLFCRGCIGQWENQSDNKKNCPKCQQLSTLNLSQQETELKPDYNAQQFLQDINVDCVYKKNGCQDIISYADYEDHIKSCPKRIKYCLNCGESFICDEADLHKSICQHQMTEKLILDSSNQGINSNRPSFEKKFNIKSISAVQSPALNDNSSEDFNQQMQKSPNAKRQVGFKNLSNIAIQRNSSIFKDKNILSPIQMRKTQSEQFIMKKNENYLPKLDIKQNQLSTVAQNDYYSQHGENIQQQYYQDLYHDEQSEYNQRQRNQLNAVKVQPQQVVSVNQNTSQLTTIILTFVVLLLIVFIVLQQMLHKGQENTNFDTKRFYHYPEYSFPKRDESMQFVVDQILKNMTQEFKQLEQISTILNNVQHKYDQINNTLKQNQFYEEQNNKTIQQIINQVQQYKDQQIQQYQISEQQHKLIQDNITNVLQLAEKNYQKIFSDVQNIINQQFTNYSEQINSKIKNDTSQLVEIFKLQKENPDLQQNLKLIEQNLFQQQKDTELQIQTYLNNQENKLKQYFDEQFSLFGKQVSVQQLSFIPDQNQTQFQNTDMNQIEQNIVNTLTTTINTKLGEQLLQNKQYFNDQQQIFEQMLNEKVQSLQLYNNNTLQSNNQQFSSLTSQFNQIQNAQKKNEFNTYAQINELQSIQEQSKYQFETITTSIDKIKNGQIETSQLINSYTQKISNVEDILNQNTLMYRELQNNQEEIIKKFNKIQNSTNTSQNEMKDNDQQQDQINKLAINLNQFILEQQNQSEDLKQIVKQLQSQLQQIITDSEFNKKQSIIQNLEEMNDQHIQNENNSIAYYIPVIDQDLKNEIPFENTEEKYELLDTFYFQFKQDKQGYFSFQSSERDNTQYQKKIQLNSDNYINQINIFYNSSNNLSGFEFNVHSQQLQKTQVGRIGNEMRKYSIDISNEYMFQHIKEIKDNNQVIGYQIIAIKREQ